MYVREPFAKSILLCVICTCIAGLHQSLIAVQSDMD